MTEAAAAPSSSLSSPNLKPVCVAGSAPSRSASAEDKSDASPKITLGVRAHSSSLSSPKRRRTGDAGGASDAAWPTSDTSPTSRGASGAAKLTSGDSPTSELSLLVDAAECATSAPGDEAAASTSPSVPCARSLWWLAAAPTSPEKSLRTATSVSPSIGRAIKLTADCPAPRRCSPRLLLALGLLLAFGAPTQLCHHGARAASCACTTSCKTRKPSPINLTTCPVSNHNTDPKQSPSALPRIHRPRTPPSQKPCADAAPYTTI